MDIDRPNTPNRATPVAPEAQPGHTMTYWQTQCVDMRNCRDAAVVAADKVRTELLARIAELEAERDRLRTERDASERARRGLTDTLSRVRDLLWARGGEGVSDAATRVHDRVSELERRAGNANVRERMLEEQLKLARYERDRLCEANTRLKAEAHRIPAGAYLIREPGVYVANLPSEGGTRLEVTRHPLNECVMLTADPSGASQWWNVYRDGITGEVVAWAPPEPVQTDVLALVKLHPALTGTPWMGVDPGKPTTAPLGPSQHWAERIERIEAWAKQFDNSRLARGGGFAGCLEVKPLADVTP